MFDCLYEESLSRAEHRIWILSDLQQALPENTRRCLDAGISDFKSMGLPADHIWYLGDAVEGEEKERLRDMCRLQEEAFASLSLPLCYATGNHDYDYARAHRDQVPWLPFYETVRDHPGWKTADSCEDFWFHTEVGKYPVYFYGHSHIGDWKWAKKDAWRRISWVDWHDVPQIDVSSFENIRGRSCRSVFLHIHREGTMGVFFRDHDRHCFTEAYFPSPENGPAGWDDMRGLWG